VVEIKLLDPKSRFLQMFLMLLQIEQASCKLSKSCHRTHYYAMFASKVELFQGSKESSKHKIRAVTITF